MGGFFVTVLLRARWLALLLVACRHAAPEPPPAPPRPELWVDASAAEGGDGSRERPLRAFVPRAGFITHLATGLYEVGGALPDDLEVVGEGKAVVLHVGEVPLSLRRATLRRVGIQGGQVGLVALERVVLDDVTFSGQRTIAARVEAGGSLSMTGGAVEGSVPETRGVVVLGHLDLARVSFGGALRHAVAVEAGEATLSDVRSAGAAEAMHVTGGRASASRVRAEGGRGPAFFVARGSLTLRDVQVTGHEYAVLTGEKAQLDVDGLTSDRAAMAAFGLVSSTAVVRHVTVTRPGPHGAVESLGSQTRLEDLTVQGATDVGVLVRQGRLDATKVRILGVRADSGSGGDGLMVRDAVAKVSGLTVEDAGGSGVVATAVATLELDGLTCRRCVYGALLVERRASAKVRNVVCEGAREAAVSVPDDGVLELDGLEVSGGGPAVWAECTAGTRVVLRGKLPARQLLSGRCIELPRGSGQ